MTERTPNTPTTPHASHDRLLVVAGLESDAPAAERLILERQLRDCAECRALAADLAAISASIRSDLPQPPRPRDFRLSADQAARLRGSPLSRLLERLAAPSFGALQPLAGVAMAVGLTLIVLNSVSLPFGGTAAAPEAPKADDRAVTSQGVPGAGPTFDAAGSLVPLPAAASPDASGREYTNGGGPQGGGTPAPTPAGTTGAVLGPMDSSITPRPSGDTRLTAEAGADAAAPPPAGIVAGGVLLVTGALLLILRWAARRRVEAAD